MDKDEIVGVFVIFVVVISFLMFCISRQNALLDFMQATL